MFMTKKQLYFIVISCFLIAAFSFHYLWAKEVLIKTSSDQQKSKQEQLPGISIRGTKIEIVPKETPSEQKSKSKKGKALTKKQPQIFFDATQYDAGEVWGGNEVVHTFIVKNKGTGKLHIKDVKPG